MIKLCQMYFKATAVTCDVYSRLASYLVGECVGVLTKMESLLLLNTVKESPHAPNNSAKRMMWRTQSANIHILYN